MKKHIPLLSGLLLSTISLAQTNTFPTTGNVGIGTTSPSGLLEIKSAGDGNQLRIWDSSWPDDSYVGFGIYGANQSSELASFGYRYRIGGTTNSGIQFGTSTSSLMTLLNNGNVGIGTASPSGKFQSYISANRYIGHNVNGADLSVLSDNNNAPVFKVVGTGNADLVNVFDSNSEVFTILDGGNVGIGTGTNAPSSKLEVNGMVTVRAGDENLTSLKSSIGDITIQAGSDDVWLKTGGSGSEAIGFINSIGEHKLFADMELGNIGIGTTTPGEKLEVNGNALIDGEVYSKKVKVSVDPGNWPDYVFASSYELLALSEVEDFVKKNGHLPEVPSAKQVEKDGLDLGSMDATLLKKVEELTLYMIEMKKEIEVLKEENMRLSNEVKKVKK